MSVLIGGVVLLAACGGDDSSSDSANDGGSLDGTSWLLDVPSTGVDGADDISAPMSFTADSVSGSTGCNSFSGTYTASGSDLEFGALATTQMACVSPASDVEAVVVAGLDEVRQYAIEGQQLLLRNGDGETVLTYESYDPRTTIEGAWEITGYLDAANEVFTGPMADTTVTVFFSDDGTVSGSAGCNQFNGTYEVTDGTLSIGPLASTEKLCPDPAGIMEQEALVLANLEAAATVSQEANGVVLLDADGTRVLTLTPPAG